MDVESRDAAAVTLPSQIQSARRNLLLRDGAAFLTLSVVVVVLGAVTTLLFRTFETRREDLAMQWAERGRTALAQGDAREAVESLRTSLVYRPGVRENQLALARSLAASGHAAEAESYFLNLWQQQPGDGVINLELARLKRQLNQPLDAIEYYRAAVFGTWSGDAPARRRDTRLELSDFLIERNQSKAAQAELLIAAGNNPDAASQLRIADALDRAGDAKDALTAFRNVADDKHLGSAASERLGELCYRMGDYPCAVDAIGRALRNAPRTWHDRNALRSLQENAERLQQLSVSPDLSSSLRGQHLLDDAHIARLRLDTCVAGGLQQSVVNLQAEWKALDTSKNRAQLRHDDDLQDGYRSLIFSSEKAAAAAQCGAPAGDDALLLYLEEHPATRFGAKP